MGDEGAELLEQRLFNLTQSASVGVPVVEGRVGGYGCDGVSTLGDLLLVEVAGVEVGVGDDS